MNMTNRANPLASADAFGRMNPGTDSLRGSPLPRGPMISPNYTGASGRFNFPPRPTSTPENPPIMAQPGGAPSAEQMLLNEIAMQSPGGL